MAHHMAAGPPASKPRKKPDLINACQEVRSLSHHTGSYLPNAANEVHGNEASRKALDEVPASVKRLVDRKVNYGTAYRHLRSYLFVPELALKSIENKNRQYILP